MHDTVQVVEVGLRDGLQMVDHTLPTDAKLAWLEVEAFSGVRRFEVASFVPAKYPQMAGRGRAGRSRPQAPGP